MYSTVPVPVPQREKGLSIKKIGNARYVYYNAAYKYSAQTKKTSPQSKSIGKVIEDDPGMMFPNENYARYFPDEAAEHLRGRTKTPDTQDPDSGAHFVHEAWQVKVGGYLAIDAILERLQLKPLIRDIFGERTALFLDLLACCVLTEGRLDWEHYQEEHILYQKGMQLISVSEAVQFLRSISEEDCHAFLGAWNRQQDHSHPVTVCCSSTGTSSAGIHYAIAHDSISKRPVLYQYAPGSLLGIPELQKTADLLKSDQWDSLCFLLDDDTASPEVIRAIAAIGYPFVVYTDSMNPLVHDPLEDLRDTLEAALEYYQFQPGMFGASQVHRLWAEGQMKCSIHIHYQPRAAARAEKELSAAVSAWEAVLEKHIGKTVSLEPEFQKYFSLEWDEEGNLLSFQRRDDVLQDVFQHSGYLVLVTGDRQNGKDAMDWYNCRDNGAPPFRMDGLFPAGSEFSHGGMLLSFAVQIVWNEMYALLLSSKKQPGLIFHFSPVSDGLAALENVKIVRNEAHQYRLASPLKKTQKDIFTALGVAPDVAVQRAWEIGLQLQTAAFQASSAAVRRSEIQPS